MSRCWKEASERTNCEHASRNDYVISGELIKSQHNNLLPNKQQLVVIQLNGKEQRICCRSSEHVHTYLFVYVRTCV